MSEPGARETTRDEASAPRPTSSGAGPSVESDEDVARRLQEEEHVQSHERKHAAGREGGGEGQRQAPPASAPASSAAGPSVESDEDIARRLFEEEQEQLRRAAEEQHDDEAIARQLAQLDMESAATGPPGAPAPEVGLDEALARQLHEEELRAQGEGRLAVAQPRSTAAPHSQAPIASATVRMPEHSHRFVSDLDDVVGQIRSWMQRRASEALNESQQVAADAPAPGPDAPGTPSSGRDHAQPGKAGGGGRMNSPPSVSGTPLYITPEGYGEESYSRPPHADDEIGSGRARLAAQPEVELVSFADPAHDPLGAADAISMDAELEELILGRLCGLLHAMLSDGLTQPILGGLFQGGARTPWSLFEAWAGVIEARCESQMDERARAKPSVCLIGLLKAVQRVGQLYSEDNGGAAKRAEFPPLADFKFRTLVCYGLNVGELHEWFSMLALDGPAEQLFDWYEQNAFVHLRETMLVAAEKLVPLASEPFRLPLQLEVRVITRDSAVYGWSAMQPVQSWL